MTKLVPIIIFFLISFNICGSNIFSAKVIGITDGDTFTVLTKDKKQIKIRLEGIDCPEKGQDFGLKATTAISELCFNKNVRVEETGKDAYKRVLAYVYVGDVCVNKELIKQGMAWHFKKYNKNKELADLELKAKKEKTGLWSMDNPKAPWDWRKEKKDKRKSLKTLILDIFQNSYE